MVSRVDMQSFRNLSQAERCPIVRKISSGSDKELAMLDEYKIKDITNEEIVLDIYLTNNEELRLPRNLITDVDLSTLKIGQCFTGISYFDITNNCEIIGIQFVQPTEEIKTMSEEEIGRFYDSLSKKSEGSPTPIHPWRTL